MKLNMQNQAETTWSHFEIRISQVVNIVALNSVFCMKSKQFCADSPFMSYVLGLIVSDGNIYFKNSKGRVAIEINHKDSGILLKILESFPLYSSVRTRTRTTNFSKNAKTSIWTCSRASFCQWLYELGIPHGKKSSSVAMPEGVKESDFWRGVIDGDGSLGFNKKGWPFISLTLSSERLRDQYLKYLKDVTGKTFNPSRNARDGVYNIMVWKEDAIALSLALYADADISLERKQALAAQISFWKRPESMRRVENKRSWNSDEDKIVLTHTCDEAMAILNRSKNSIKCRRRKLISM